jgi:1,2-diacylglycerol 3-beta-galactosyltransferase
MQQAIRLFHRFQVNLIEEYWRGDPPAMAVSLVPNFNRAIYQALRRVTPTVPYVTVLTDIADYPPHFWIERDQDQYFICGSPKALRQASDAGHPANRIFGTSGMILRPAFYDVPAVDRAAERAKLGLDPDLPTALILFGGHGAPVIATIIERLQTVHRPLQVIAMCGHNEKLAAQLKRAGSKVPLHVQGFTREVPRFMQIADFMIGKPGPGSISEAVHMGLPVIVERNAWTLPQERYNADWLIENGVGIVLDNFTRIVSGVDNLLAEGHLDTYRAAARRMNNRAIFEVPDILERILCASRK